MNIINNLSRLIYLNLYTIAFILFNTLIFFTWIKIAQLNALNSDLFAYYPLKYYLLTLFSGALFSISIWLLTSIFICFFTSKERFLFIFRTVGISFVVLLTGPLLYVYQQSNPSVTNYLTLIHPLQMPMLLFLFINFLVFLFNIDLQRIKQYILDILALFIIYCIIYYLIPSLSPLHLYDIRGWLQEWDGVHGVTIKPLIDMVYYQIPLIDQSLALGTNPTPILHINHSYLTGLLSVFWGLSPLDIIGRLLLYKNIFFVIVLISSFFFYLYLRHAIKLSFFSSLFGGVFYFLSNTTLLNQLHYYSVGFWLPFFVLPIALFFLTISARLKKLLYAAVAGYSFSLSVCLFQAHPDSHRMVLLFVLFPYSVVLFLYTFKCNFLKFSNFLGVFALFLLIGYSIYALPIYDSLIYGEQFFSPYKFLGVQWSSEYFLDIIKKILLIEHTLPHSIDPTNDQNGVKYLIYIGYFLILVIFSLFSIKEICLYDKLNRCIFLFWYGLTIYVLYIILFADSSITHYFMSYFKTGYIRSLYRFSPIWHVCVVVVSTIALDYLIKSKSKKLEWALSTYLIMLFSAILMNITDNRSIVEFFKENELTLMLIKHKISIITSLCAILLIIRLRNEPSLLNKIVFFIGSLMIFINIFPDIAKVQNGSDSYQSLKSTLFNYISLEDDPLSLNYIRKKILRFSEDTNIKSSELNEIVDNKNNLISFAKTNVDTIDKFYSEKLSIYKPWQIYWFNRLVPEKITENKGYWMAFPHFAMPISTYPSLDFVKWFGGHGLVRTSNRSYYLYLNNMEWGFPDPSGKGYKPYNLDKWFIHCYNVSGIEYIVMDSRFNKMHLDVLLQHGYFNINNLSLTDLSNNSQLIILRNNKSFGRVYFAEKVFAVPYLEIEKINQKKEPDLFHKKIEKARDYINNLRYREAVVENIDNEMVENINSIENKGIIKNTNIKGNKAVFDVEVPEEKSFLVYNVGALKDWVAFIDDKETPIYYSNIAFMGVVVPEGKHLVWFEYRPTAKFVGLLIVLLASSFLCLWFICDYIKGDGALR